MLNGSALEIDGAAVTGPLTIPNTGGWQKWTTVTAAGVALTAGPHEMRVVFTAAGPTGMVGNLNHVRIDPQNSQNSQN